MIPGGRSFTGGSNGGGHKREMTLDRRTARFQNTTLDERLADWLGWFSDAPLPEAFTVLVDQLEAAYQETARVKVEA